MLHFVDSRHNHTPELHAALFALAGALEGSHVRLEARVPKPAKLGDSAMFVDYFWTPTGIAALSSQLRALEVTKCPVAFSRVACPVLWLLYGHGWRRMLNAASTACTIRTFTQ